MGFMTMLLTNPFIYSWIVERISQTLSSLQMNRTNKMVGGESFVGDRN